MSVASSNAGINATADVTKTPAKINKQIFTPLVADDEQKKMGFNFVVVHNESRELKGGFVDSADAADFCDMLNTR
jgi:hypothetical protein